MGYYTQYSGEITINPPIPWTDINTDYLPQNAWRSNVDVQLRIDETTVNTDEGILILRKAIAIQPVTDEPYKGYDIIDHVQRIVDSYGDGHTFNGFISCQGDESGDLWRLEVRDGQAVKVRPRIVWPDGSEEPTQ